MSFDLALLSAYTATAALLLVIPGPTIMTVVAYGLSQGPRAAWASTLGVVAGDAIAVVASLTGLGAIMAREAKCAVPGCRHTVRHGHGARRSCGPNLQRAGRADVERRATVEVPPTHEGQR